MSIKDLFLQVVQEKLDEYQKKQTGEYISALDDTHYEMSTDDRRQQCKGQKSKNTKAKERFLHDEEKQTSQRNKKRNSSKSCKEFMQTISNNISSESNNYTSDGFRIISAEELADDDSDVESAFETVDEEVDSVDKFTTDGFKIISVDNLPDDDSDISDAFETDSDVECEERSKASSVLVNKSSSLGSKFLTSTNTVLHSKQAVNFSKKTSAAKSDNNKPSMVENKSRFSLAINDVEKSSKLKSKTAESNTLFNSSIAVNLDEGKSRKQKRKRGGRKNKEAGKASTVCTEMTSNQLKRSKKKRKIHEGATPLAEEDIVAIKSKFHPKIQYIIDSVGLDWARFDTPENKEKRELAKLPQPEQIPNCVAYLKKERSTGKVYTVYDYSKPTRTVVEGKAVQSAIQTEAQQSSLEKSERKQELKNEQREVFRTIRHTIDDKILKKPMTAKEKQEDMMTKLKRLGAVVKNPYVNYKVLMQNKKKEKERIAADNEELKNLGMHNRLKKKRLERHKKTPHDVPVYDGLLGSYKDGVLRISKKDIARIGT